MTRAIKKKPAPNPDKDQRITEQRQKVLPPQGNVLAPRHRAKIARQAEQPQPPEEGTRDSRFAAKHSLPKKPRYRPTPPKEK